MRTEARPFSIPELVSPASQSGRIELHLIPRPPEGGGGPLRRLTGIVGPDLGAIDWQKIDPLPVRASKGVPRASIPAQYAWQRHGPEHVWCESQYEKNQVMWLDWQGEVQRLWPQPFAIVWPASTVGLRWHVPDFLGLSYDGRAKVFDARPAERMNDRVKLQFAMTAEVCAELGWPYQVLDGAGQSPQATENLKWLKAARHARCAPPSDVRERILARAQHGTTWRTLCEVADPDCPARAATWVDYLAWHQHLSFDPHRTYGPTTLLTHNPKGVR